MSSKTMTCSCFFVGTECDCLSMCAYDVSVRLMDWSFYANFAWSWFAMVFMDVVVVSWLYAVRAVSSMDLTVF